MGLPVDIPSMIEEGISEDVERKHIDSCIDPAGHQSYPHEERADVWQYIHEGPDDADKDVCVVHHEHDHDTNCLPVGSVREYNKKACDQVMADHLVEVILGTSE